MNKMVIAGLIVAALMFSGLGIMAMAQEDVNDDLMTQEELDEYTLSEGVPQGDDAKYLLTEEQIVTMKTTAQELRDAHATRTEIRETVQAMASEYVQENLESYGLAEEEIAEIQVKITQLMDKMLEVRETAHDLWEQDMNRQDIREEIKPLIDEAQVIRGELKDMLDQYGILPPEIHQPGFGDGPQGQNRHGMGQGEGRQNRHGGFGGFNGESGGESGGDGSGEFCGEGGFGGPRP